ncbi:hypothetical protein Tco_0569513 [Tanacetum coccineum]
MKRSISEEDKYILNKHDCPRVAAGCALTSNITAFISQFDKNAVTCLLDSKLLLTFGFLGKGPRRVSNGVDRKAENWNEKLENELNAYRVPTKKPKPPVIPILPIHQVDHLLLGGKGKVDEVFGMSIPKDLITDAIQNSEYYKKYLEMASRKPRQPTTMTGKEVEKKKAPKADEEPQHASELQVEDDEYNL